MIASECEETTRICARLTIFSSRALAFAMKLAGYDTDFALVPADGSPLRVVAARVPGWRAIEGSA